MKTMFLALAITLISYSTYAQTNTFPTSGNAGIGTTNPNDKLDINGNLSLTGGSREIRFRDVDNVIKQYLWLTSANFLGLGTGAESNSMYISTGGSVGIGTTSPNDKLDINGNLSLTGGSREIRFRDVDNVIKQYLWLTSANFLGLGTGAESSSMYISTGGNVGIGTLDPKGYKLAVAGSAIAESVTVKLQGSWPDYVFKPSYKLRPLSEVKSYIVKNNYLPDMPSEQEVTKNGINLGEMNKLLTKKVEELTLYLIEENRRNQDQLEQQNKRIATLERALLKLTTNK